MVILFQEMNHQNNNAKVPYDFMPQHEHSLFDSNWSS